jgi:long-chain acyl-CoA synthetase
MGGTRPAGVFDVLRRPLREAPDSEALVTRSARLTYRDLDREAGVAAAAMVRLGLRPGDRLAVSLPNDADIVVAFHAAMRAGLVWVGINQVLAPPEKAYMLRDAGAAVLLTDTAPAVSPDHPARIVTLDEWRTLVAAARQAGEIFGAGSGGRSPEPDVEVAAAIAYTSGTTGFPKGAVHCQAGLILPGAATVRRRGWGRSLRKGDSLPLTILNMLTLTTLLTAQAGGTAVIMDRSDTGSIAGWIETEKVQVWNGPPAQLWTMVRDETIDPAALSSLEEVWAGGADCPDQLRRDFRSRFNVPVCRTYGLTEAPALVALDDVEDLAPAGCSGRPLDHIEVTVDGEEIVLRPAPHGDLAGLYRPSLGYWGQPPNPSRSLPTGDLGRMEPSGHLRVLGRRSTVIIRGGANIYPAEVERVLSDAPGVGSSSVVGLPDERLGERVAAAVEPAAGAVVDLTAVDGHCRANLAAYKVPERWLVVDRLPRNQMGKVPGPVIKEMFATKEVKRL